MGKIIRGCRKGKGSIFKSHTRNRIGQVKLRALDYAERQGYMKGVVKEVRAVPTMLHRFPYLMPLPQVAHPLPLRARPSLLPID